MGCSTGSAPAQDTTTIAAPLPEVPRCPEAPANAVAVFDRAGERCPWVVFPAGETSLAVAGIDSADRAIATYELPAACVSGGCELEGVDDLRAPGEARPLLVLARRAEDTGHPTEVWVGFASKVGHRFVPTWREPDVRSDLSRVGPAFHLAPHRCPDGIALLVERRLDGEGDAPAESTIAAEGYPSSIVEDEVVTTPVDAAQRSACVRLDVPLP